MDSFPDESELEAFIAEHGEQLFEEFKSFYQLLHGMPRMVIFGRKSDWYSLLDDSPLALAKDYGSVVFVPEHDLLLREEGVDSRYALETLFRKEHKGAIDNAISGLAAMRIGYAADLKENGMSLYVDSNFRPELLTDEDFLEGVAFLAEKGYHVIDYHPEGKKTMVTLRQLCELQGL